MEEHIKKATKNKEDEVKLHKAAKKAFVKSEEFRRTRDAVHKEAVREVKVSKTTKTAQARADKLIKIYDAKNKERLPGTMALEFGKLTDDQTVNEAYTNSKATFVFYNVILGRNSIKNMGEEIVATVHYGKRYMNAFWDGEQMVFGDGGGPFLPLTRDLDVTAHEQTHGRIGTLLEYQDQAGALNESLADVYASVVEQYDEKQTVNEALWLIGDKIMVRKGQALRSLKAPGTAYDDPYLGKDDQPYRMGDYVVTKSDNGGVHTNSGIPNHAFYLFATKIGGNSWEQAIQVWERALEDRALKPNSTFKQFAKITIRVCGELYGKEKFEQRMLREAWAETEVIM